MSRQVSWNGQTHSLGVTPMNGSNSAFAAGRVGLAVGQKYGELPTFVAMSN